MQVYRVEVIIRGHTPVEEKGQRYPLRGKLVRYTDPFGSVAENDREALRRSLNFTGSPANQIIATTARVYDCPLITSDSKILEYIHVDTVK